MYLYNSTLVIQYTLCSRLCNCNCVEYATKGKLSKRRKGRLTGMFEGF